MATAERGVAGVSEFLERVERLNTQYRAGQIHARVPPALRDGARPLDSLVAEHLPASQRALEAAAHGLFYSLVVAFDPAESVGPYLALFAASLLSPMLDRWFRPDPLV